MLLERHETSDTAKKLCRLFCFKRLAALGLFGEAPKSRAIPATWRLKPRTVEALRFCLPSGRPCRLEIARNASPLRGAYEARDGPAKRVVL
jgi:hypothetical protein